MQTTGVLIIHNDCSLLKDTLESAKSLIDRLVVVDGAYEWVAPFCDLRGENPMCSTDNLFDILNASGIPYSYHMGIWKNETHKRLASLSYVETERAMLIDSDEIYDVSTDHVDEFWKSGKALGSLRAPLFLHDNVVTLHTESKNFPIKPVFINLKNIDIRQVLSSLWLVLPESEKGPGLDREQIAKAPIGSLYHLSMFRTGDNPYHRSRFYNLLAMRVAKKIGLGLNKSFVDDAEFISIIREMDCRALDALFKTHRIGASFIKKKNNHEFVNFEVVSDFKRDVIRESYLHMLADQHRRTADICGDPLRVFNGSSVFIDVTGAIQNQMSGVELTCEKDASVNIVWHIDRGVIRDEVSIVQKCGHFPDEANDPSVRRVLAELQVRKVGAATVNFSFNLIS